MKNSTTKWNAEAGVNWMSQEIKIHIITMETLFFKEKNIIERDVELIFHKEYTYMFNDTSYPIVKYSLFNCNNFDAANFDNIAFSDDGVTIEIEKQLPSVVFQISDGWNEYKIVCENVKEEELEYRSKDLVDIVKAVKKENDDQYEQIASFNKRLENLKSHLFRELNIIDRKLEQATWLTEERKHFFIAKKSIIQEAIQLIAE